MRIAGIFIVIFLSCESQAITWDFGEQGNAQGWIAQEGDMAGDGNANQALHAEVHDGIWRITVPPFQKGRNPEVLLISPTIGHDSALFDRLTIRFRVVHTQPIPGFFTLRWTNPANLSYPGGDPSNLGSAPCANPNCHSRFWILDNLIYTADWQEVTIGDLRSRTATWPGGDQYEILWEGELTDIRVDLGLWNIEKYQDAESLYIQGADEVPEAVEIDWIKLTGVEEQLQGERPPPPTAADIPSGRLFDTPVFYPLGVRQVGSKYGSQWTGVLGDLDGDGDLDMVTPWTDKDDHGWLLAFNDGKGEFAHVQVEHFPAAKGNTPFVGGADLDGNGRMDLVLWPGTGQPVQVWLNDAQKGWQVDALADFHPLALLDLDKDGDLDLWGWASDPSVFFASRFLFNNGKGNFSNPLSVEPPAEGYFAYDLVYPATSDKRVPLLWRKYGGSGQLIAYQTALGEVVQETLPVLRALEWNLTVKGGDFDLDGHMDLIVADQGSNRLSEAGIFPTKGLNALHNRGDGQMDTVSTFPEIAYNGNVQVSDLNRDGLVDLVVWHYDLRVPSMVVLVQQHDGRFVQEGDYPLLVGRGGSTLSGDLDNDGDMDLVMFDSFVAGGGGVHVFLSRLPNHITAVEEEATITPSQSRLGVAYPNPFNPGVVIPFTMGPSAAPVILTIYNALGQQVWKLGLGELPAGAHQAEWNGRDEGGQVMSSGVYLYRLQAGAWSAVGKVVKSE
jgi:hypothetical protein